MLFYAVVIWQNASVIMTNLCDIVSGHVSTSCLLVCHTKFCNYL